MPLDVSSVVRHIVRDHLHVPEALVTPEATFMQDLEARPLGLVKLVGIFEQTFGFEIPDQDVEKLHTVRDAIDYINVRRRRSVH